MSRTTLAVITAIFFIFGAAVVAIFLARGYQLDITKKSLVPTGILVATSDPDGAEVFINGKLQTATNNTLNLAPGSYSVRLQKEGFTSWEKKIIVKKEEVIKTNAFLFPNLPDLRPLTFSGALNPVLSPDGAKIAFLVASSSSKLNGNGVWVLDMGRGLSVGPLSAGASPRQVYRTNSADVAPNSLLAANPSLSWSADSKQVLAFLPAPYLLEADSNNEKAASVTLPLPLIQDEWASLTAQRYQAQLVRLPATLRQTLATGAGQLSFSPDESKILYLATASASLPLYLSSYLPGTNPTPQTRDLKPGNLYVYDLKEDKNYLIISDFKLPDLVRSRTGQTSNFVWFPSSRHILETNDREIAVREYDGTNRAVVFSGPFTKDAVFAWPNWSKIIILTDLGNPNGAKNLYTINLR